MIFVSLQHLLLLKLQSLLRQTVELDEFVLVRIVFHPGYISLKMLL